MRDTNRPNKPRGLGRVARQLATDAQCKLTAADRRLQPLYDGEVSDPGQVREIANAVGRLISNAAKFLSDQLGLGTAPDENGGTHE